jgi:hypothetical protein
MLNQKKAGSFLLGPSRKAKLKARKSLMQSNKKEMLFPPKKEVL